MSITILIHSSKTMRAPAARSGVTTPELLTKTRPLASYLQSLTPAQLQKAMHISEPLSHKVHTAFAAWSTEPTEQCLAIDSFVGDIYSGLRGPELSESDRDYAQQTLRILSGLYGILRPYDGVRPYRLEMGYTLPDPPFSNLYRYWGEDIARTISRNGIVVNVSAVEYTKTVLPYIDAARVITPRFLTLDVKSGKPGQVIVHTKIARGAFARWLIMQRVTAASHMTQFNDLGYRYDAALSTPSEPTFACESFGGIGLSIRLSAAPV